MVAPSSVGLSGKHLREDFRPGYIFRGGLGLPGRAMGRAAPHAEGQVRAKAQRCKLHRGSGNKDVNMSKVATGIPLFFLIFKPKTLSLFILNILFWMLQRLSVGVFFVFALLL